MLSRLRRSLGVATLLAILTACGAPVTRSPAWVATPLVCYGGRIRTEEDASSYARCVHVAGDLRIERSELLDLSGLEHLKSVSGALVIVENAGLYRVRGLDNLREVGDLVIAENRRLIDLSALRNLEAAGSVRISRNPRLCARLGLLPALASVARSFTLTAHAGLSKHDVDEVTVHVKSATSTVPP
jgi:hypothetical protein